MVSCWWSSVSHATAAVFLWVLVFSWVFGVVSRMGNPDKEMLGESVLAGCVSVRIIVVAMEVSR